jgi:hypothetical protein
VVVRDNMLAFATERKSVLSFKRRASEWRRAPRSLQRQSGCDGGRRLTEALLNCAGIA